MTTSNPLEDAYHVIEVNTAANYALVVGPGIYSEIAMGKPIYQIINTAFNVVEFETTMYPSAKTTYLDFIMYMKNGTFTPPPEISH